MLKRSRYNKKIIIGVCWLVFVFLLCFLGPLVTGHNKPDDINVSYTLQPPSFLFPFGTDAVGRDQLARVMVGGKLSLIVGFGSMLITIFVGVTIGATSAYLGGVVDSIFMRITDITLSIPSYLLLFVISVSFVNGSLAGIIILISLFSWPTTARLVRGEVLVLKEKPFILAAQSLGTNKFRIVFRHILPNIAGTILTNATLTISNSIIFESVLSYFGFGLHPPMASWGNLVGDNQSLFEANPWLILFPSIFIYLTILCCNLVGTGIHDVLDPSL